MIKKYFLLSAGIVILTTALYAMIIVDTPVLLKLTDSSMELIKKNNFKKLYANFFVPDNYSKEGKRIDGHVVPEGLKYLITHELGSFKQYKKVFNFDRLKTLNVAMAGLSPGTQSHTPKTSVPVTGESAMAFTGVKKAYKDYYCLNVVYDVQFKKFGQAYLMFQVYTKKGVKFEIIRVAVLMPAANKKARSVYQNFTKKINVIAAEAK